MPSAMSSRRPAALSRGATAKPMSLALRIAARARDDLDQRLQAGACLSLRAGVAGRPPQAPGCWRPAARGRRRCPRRRGRAMCRGRDLQRRNGRPRASAYAMPAARRTSPRRRPAPCSAKPSPGWLGLTIASAGGNASPGRWWSVTSTCQPSALAAAMPAWQAMPWSTVTSRSGCERGKLADQRRRQAIAMHHAIRHRVRNAASRRACAGRAPPTAHAVAPSQSKSPDNKDVAVVDDRVGQQRRRPHRGPASRPAAAGWPCAVVRWPGRVRRGRRRCDATAAEPMPARGRRRRLGARDGGSCG